MIKLDSQQKAKKAALDQIYETSPFALIGHLFVILLVGYLLIDSVPSQIIFLGVGSHFFILTMRAYTIYHYFKIQTSIDTPEAINRWIKYYIVNTFLMGTAWGFSFLLFSYDIPVEQHFFLYAVLFGLAGAGVATLGTILSVYLSFILPMFSIFSLWLLSQDEKIYMISVLLLFTVIGFYYFAVRRYSTNFSKAIIEKDYAIQTQYEIIKRLSNISELKDYETSMHIIRMSYYTYILAQESGQDKDFTEDILHASAMHDIGKLAIPDYILLKAGPLNDEEWHMMKMHTEAGKMILEGSESKLIQLSESIAFSHHEKYDGSGYPRSLKGEEIPIEGRIAAIADVFDALVSVRPYKKKWSNEEAFAFIQEKSGTHFDPELVKHFITLTPQILAFQKKHTDRSENTR